MIKQFTGRNLVFVIAVKSVKNFWNYLYHSLSNLLITANQNLQQQSRK